MNICFYLCYNIKYKKYDIKCLKHKGETMKGKTHAGIGAVTYISLCDKLPGGFDYFGLIIVVIASLFPDIDHPKSIINKYILPFRNKKTKITIYVCLGIIVLWFDYLFTNKAELKALAISLFVIALSSHRNGVTHSLVGLIIFALIFGYLGKYYNWDNVVYYFISGYGMHLLCDMMTKMGVPLFYPFRKKKVRFPVTYKSSSKIGAAFEDFIVIIGLMYVIYRIPHIF